MGVYQDKKNKTWFVHTSWYENGKRKYKTIRGFQTKRSAQKAEIDFKDQLNHGMKAAENPTFSDYYDKWVDIYKKNSVSPNTYENYLLDGRRIKKLFGNMKLKNITRTTYQSILNEFGKEHAKVTVTKFHKAIKSCVRSAIKDKILQNNFTDDITVTYNKDKGLKVTYLELDQIKKLLQYLVDNRNPHFPGSYMILASLYTGLRESELAGLYWSDIDYDNCELHIKRAWVYKQHDYGPTKNRSSKRTIGIDSNMLKLLDELRINDPKRVFWSKARKGFPNTKSLNRVLRAALKDLNISAHDYHFHSLRHSQVAILLDPDLNISTKEIADRLGHSSTKMVEEVYGYELKKYRHKVNKKVNQAFDDLIKNN